MPEGDLGSNVDLSTGPVVARAYSSISLLLILQIRLILTDYPGLLTKTRFCSFFNLIFNAQAIPVAYKRLGFQAATF